MVTASPERIGHKTLAALLTGRSPAPRRFYKASPDGEIAYLSEAQEFQVDEARMAVGPVTISTPAIDRVGDILVPAGCDLEDYKTNPVIYWEHGYSGEDGGSMPIASAADADGNLSVEITDEAVKSWAYFHGKTKLSDQVFSLIACKAIRAASVRPMALDSTLIAHEVDGGEMIGLQMDRWSMSEWSFVAIGCNPEALAKSVRDNRIEGKSIAAPLLKSLKKFVPEKPVKGIGMALKKTPVKSKPKSDVPPEDEELKNDGMDEDEELKSEIEDDEEAPAETKDSPTDPEEPVDDEEPTQMKYGAQVLSAASTALGDLVKNMEATLGPLENEEVKAALTEMLGTFKEQQAAIEGLYGSQYPDSPSLTPSEDEDKSDAIDEEALKSYLSAGMTTRYQWSGYAIRLKGLMSAKNLTPRQKRELAETVKSMQRMEQESRSHVKSALERKVEKLAALFEANQKKLAEFLPHERSA